MHSSPRNKTVSILWLGLTSKKVEHFTTILEYSDGLRVGTLATVAFGSEYATGVRFNLA
jgi:hypothetical protein